MSGKAVRLIALTFMITAVMFLMKSGLPHAERELRNLVTDKQVEDICQKAFTGKLAQLALNYTSYFTNSSITLATYLTPNRTDDSQKLINFIKTNNTDDLMSYIWSRASPYIVFIAFAVISLITWIVLCVCCCKPCCCYKQTEDDSKCFKFINVILLYLLWTGIIIGCIIGFVYSTKFVESINGTTCAFLVFYKKVMSGEETTKLPRWVGISNVVKVFDDTEKAVDAIIEGYAKSLPDTSWATEDVKSFQDNLVSSHNSFSSSKLVNQNPSPSKKNGVNDIIPVYIDAYGPYEKQGSTLNYVWQEFDSKVKIAVSRINDAKSSSQIITVAGNEIKNKIVDIKNRVNSLTSNFNSISDNILDSWIDVQTRINDTGIMAFLILFAVLIGIAGLSALFFLFYATCGCGFCKFFLHIFWWIICLIMILTFLLGGVFGICGLIGQDGTVAIQWIFGPENIGGTSPKIITGDGATYLNRCVNLDGDLSAAFGIQSTSTAQLDQLYTAAKYLSDLKKALKENTNSISIAEITKNYNTMIGDISLTTSETLGTNSINNQLSELRGWSDSGQNKYQKGCNQASQDVFVQNNGKCPTDYTLNAAIGSKSCLLFPEFTAFQALSRYSAQSGCQSSGSTEFIGVGDAVSKYVAALNAYTTENKNLLNSLVDNNGKINNLFVNQSGKVLSALDVLDGIIVPLVNVFENIAGKNGLFSIINCKFMGNSLANLFDQLQNNLAPSSFALAGVIIAVSFMEFLSCIIILILIRKFQNRDSASSDNLKSKN